MPIHLIQDGELCSQLLFLMELPILQDETDSPGVQGSAYFNVSTVDILWTALQEKPQVGRVSDYTEMCWEGKLRRHQDSSSFLGLLAIHQLWMPLHGCTDSWFLLLPSVFFSFNIYLFRWVGSYLCHLGFSSWCTVSSCGKRILELLGSVAVVSRLSCSAACGIFLHQESNPCPLYWQAESYPLYYQGSPCIFILIGFIYILSSNSYFFLSQF